MSLQIYENVVYPHKEDLVEAIKKYSSRDQNKTNVQLYNVTAKVYSAHEYNRDDFIEYLDWLQTVDILPSKKVRPKMWGMHYESNDVCKPHVHNTYGWTAIHYLEVDEGCGILETTHESIEPQNDMMVIMPADYCHYVLPAENPEAQRVLMVFNMDD